MRIDGPLPIAAIFLGCVLAGPAAQAWADLQVRQIAPGIYTGTAPQSEADYATLQRLQVQTVVDMRKFRPLASRQEAATVERYGMRHYLIPLGFQPTKTGTPECVLRILADACQQPVYIHCQLGRDRTGMIVALYRVRYLGWSPEAAYAAMERQQFNPLLRDLDRYFWQNAS